MQDSEEWPISLPKRGSEVLTLLTFSEVLEKLFLNQSIFSLAFSRFFCILKL